MFTPPPKKSRFTPTTWFIVIFAMVFVLVFGAGTALSFYLPKSYASTSHMTIGELSKTPPHTLDNVLTNIPATPEFDYVRKPIDTMESEIILDRVINRLHLDRHWAQKYFGGQNPTLAETRDRLKKHVSINQISDDQFFDVTAFSEDKKEAVAIASTLAETYRDYRTETYVASEEKKLKVLDEQYSAQEKEIQDTRNRLSEIRGKSNPLMDELVTSSEPLQKHEDQLAAGEEQYKKDTNQLARLKQLDPADLRSSLANLTGDANLATLLGEWENAQLAPVTNPAVAQTQLATLNRKIDSRIAGLLFALNTKLQSEKAGLDDLAVEIENLKKEAEIAPSYEAAQKKLKQLLSAHQVLADAIGREMLEAEAPSLPLIQIDELGTEPANPNLPTSLAISALAGILLGIIAGGIAAWISVRTRNQPKPIQPAAGRQVR